MNAYVKFLQLKAQVNRLHKNLPILDTPTKRIFLPFCVEIGFVVPKKTSWRQNNVRPDYVRPSSAQAISFLQRKASLFSGELSAK